MNPQDLLRLLIMLLSGLFAGCTPQTPIPVYWTATPEATQAAVLPTSTATQLPPTLTLTPEPPTATPETPALPAVTPAPVVPTAIQLTGGATWTGPIVMGNVPPPPTFAPVLPTNTPETPGAPTPEPTAAPVQPTNTPDTAAPPAPVMPNLDGTRIGIQVDINLSLEDWQFAMSKVEQLGISWVKVQLPWRDMQPDGPNQKNDEFFRRVELYLEDASNRGLNVMASIVKAPPWARSNQAEDGPPDNPQHLADFITLVYQEINADQFRSQVGEYIDAVEIWNEPNLLREWQGTLPFNGAGYMQLFAAGYNAVRAYSPDVVVITAGLAPTSTTGFSVDDTEFLRQMYAAGLGQYGDVKIGVHPYPWANLPDALCCDNVEGQGWDDNPHFFFRETMEAYRRIIGENGHNTQMWITEFGYASWDGFPGGLPDGDDWMGYTDRMEQGLYTIRALEILQGSPDVGTTMLWNLNFATLAGLIQNRDERAAYSIIVPGTLGSVDPNSTDRTERPLFWMLYDAVRPDVQLPSF
jgi:polysaccharide biosynthesis protein PslG